MNNVENITENNVEEFLADGLSEGLTESFTERFRTKTEFIQRKNFSANNTWGIALDIGYSSVKGFSPNSVYRFPSYARKIEGQILDKLGTGKETDLYYRADGEVWAVGKCAQDMIKSDDTRDSSLALYGRNRYFSPMFLIIARVGLALGMTNNAFGAKGDRPISLQTGLPPAYLKTDSELLKEVLVGSHNFEVKIGNKDWKRFQFELPAKDINIIPQPMGTYMSITATNDGRQAPNAQQFLNGNTLIFDPGFGTLDLFAISGKIIENTETDDNLGMKAVLEATAERIYKEYGVEIRVPAMQKNLEAGTFTVFDRKTRRTNEILFDNILEEESNKICDIALSKVADLYNNLLDFNYLVITGGTGEAWEPRIREFFGGISSLNIINGNQNDDLSFVYSNVRGYYTLLIGRLKKMEGKK